MKKFILITLLGLFRWNSSSLCQESELISNTNKFEHKHKHYIGANAGFTTGLGFAYRYWPKKSGVQISILPIYDENSMFVSVGTTYLREIKKIYDLKIVYYAKNHLTHILMLILHMPIILEVASGLILAQTTMSLSINSSVWDKMFEFKACEKFKPQYTSVFEDLNFEQQHRSRTLWTNTTNI